MKINALVFITLAIFILLACGNDQQSDLAAPTIPVYQIKGFDIPIYQEFVGQLYGYQDIAIRARVEGFLEGIFFLEGSRVNEGRKLYTLESQRFQEDVAAKMSRLAEARTVLAKAQSDLNRIEPLAKENAVSQSDLDGAVAQYEASVAGVEAAEANLRAARIQLSYTKIQSPITGIIGKTRAKVGDFVGREPNPVILNVVSRIDTMLVQFFITESQYLQIARTFLEDSELMERERDQREISLILVDGSVYKHPGKIDFVDREIDPNTGAMLVQASFPNPDELLRPGQFAKVKIRFAVIKDGIMIPQRCITELQGQYRVMVIDNDNKVRNREVIVGPKYSDFWIIQEGLALGEKVIYEGLQKVREDIIINPEIKDIKPVGM